MVRLHLIPTHTTIEFMRRRMLFFTLSILLVAASIALFATRGLNYGIDFMGGILIEVRTSGPADVGDMRSRLSSIGVGEVALQEFGAPEEVLIRIQSPQGGADAEQAAVAKVKVALGDGVEYRRVEAVGPKVSEELFLDGLMAVVAAMIAMLGYIGFRFEWQFGVAAVVALVHDIISTIGIFSLLGMEFNLSTVAAVLTIAGYSINDTVVVFDRVREDLRRYKTMPLTELFNKSINETLSRTTMTSFTTLLALFALYALGGEVIQGFSFAMIWGIVVGTYSSICVAVPLLLYLDIRRGSREEQEAAPSEAA